jgi:hypothetical protein
VNTILLDEGVAALQAVLSPPSEGDHIACEQYNEAAPLDGIIRRLTAVCGGNVCEMGAVIITARTTNSDRLRPQVNGGSPHVVVDLDTEVGWYDTNTNPSWLQFDFKDRRISMASYSIKFGQNTTHRQKWRVEGSDDGQMWQIIDNRQGEEIAHPAYSVRHFVCQSAPRPFRYVRLLVEIFDYFWGGNYQLGMAAIEFYGRLDAVAR